MRKKADNLKLFLGTFVSAFMFVFGLVTLVSMFWPVIIGLGLDSSQAYQPQLPLAEDRTEAFIDINSVPVKQLYPPLTDLAEKVSGDAIIIPAIDVDVPLVTSASVEDKDVLAVLDRGAAMYPNGITPGRLGNVFIAAHSTGEPWKGKYRFAFIRINEIETGNLIHLDYNGTRYTYRVVAKDIVKPSADFRVVSDRPVPTVTLMACWPLWTTNQRMLITAELTNITQLTQPAV
ncbi:MAG: class E sortase [bacterium]|nr:class E sortase [bacterium]